MKLGAVRRALVIAAILLVCLFTLLTLGRTILAQSGGQYDLSWSAIVGGGHSNSIGGAYALGGAVGQPGAGTLNGGQYQLEGGFWHCFPFGSEECQLAASEFTNFLPILVNPNN